MLAQLKLKTCIEVEYRSELYQHYMTKDP